MNKIQTWLLLSFVILSLPSVFFSFNKLKSIAYIGWLLANYFFIFATFSALAREHRTDFYRGFVWGFRAQIIAGLALYLLGIDLNGSEFNAGRAYLLYYEPSFFAIALTSYVGIVIVQPNELGEGKKWKGPWLDLAFLVIAIVTTKSAILLTAIVVALLIRFLLSSASLKRLATVTAIGGVLVVSVLAYASIADDLVAQTLRGVLTSESPIDYLVGRAENRVPRMLCAQDVFLDHPVAGVGLGAYEAFTRNSDLSHCLERGTFLSRQYDFITDYPPINIYVEVLATTGLLGAIPFFAFLLRVVLLRKPTKLDKTQLAYWIGLVTMLIIMNLQATYLTQCIWVALGTYFGAVQTKSPSRSSVSTNTMSTQQNLDVARAFELPTRNLI